MLRLIESIIGALLDIVMAGARSSKRCANDRLLARGSAVNLALNARLWPMAEATPADQRVHLPRVRPFPSVLASGTSPGIQMPIHRYDRLASGVLQNRRFLRTAGISKSPATSRPKSPLPATGFYGRNKPIGPEVRCTEQSSV